MFFGGTIRFVLPLLALAFLCGGGRADAGAMPSAIQGIYVDVDPYYTAPNGRPLLDAAAQIGSSSPSCATAEPFAPKPTAFC
jgi:hypothetical protein